MDPFVLGLLEAGEKKELSSDIRRPEDDVLEMIRWFQKIRCYHKSKDGGEMKLLLSLSQGAMAAVIMVQVCTVPRPQSWQF